MKFRKFGKAFLTSALSIGAVFGLSSCVQSYTVGFLYVTGQQTSGKSGQGIISGFKIDHNTGELKTVNGLPVSSGGANPGRAILLQGSRFLYVLNRGLDASGGDNCTSATSPCTGANLTLFSVSGNGSLFPQPQQFSTQGNNPFRVLADASGNFVMVLDHDAPDSGNGNPNNSCALALGSGVTTCGDITMFKVDPTTGRLSLVLNAQVSTASGQPLSYFPVPANPIDFLLSGNFLITLAGTPATGDFSYPYNYSPQTGQLSVSQNGPQPLNAHQATAIQSGNGLVYILDNEPITVNNVTSPSQIIPFSVGTGGSLQAQTGGAVADDPTQSNPLFFLVDPGSNGRWSYVANTGDNQSQTNATSGITGFTIDPATKQLGPMPGSPFGSVVGTGSGPQCMVEDPSNNFLYTANFNDSTVTGHSIDKNVGTLNALPGRANKAYALPGPAAYCLINGRTS